MTSLPPKRTQVHILCIKKYRPVVTFSFAVVELELERDRRL